MRQKFLLQLLINRYNSQLIQRSKSDKVTSAQDKKKVSTCPAVCENTNICIFSMYFLVQISKYYSTISCNV